MNHACVNFGTREYVPFWPGDIVPLTYGYPWKAYEKLSSIFLSVASKIRPPPRTQRSSKVPGGTFNLSLLLIDLLHKGRFLATVKDV